jgi:hypothetical protein
LRPGKPEVLNVANKRSVIIAHYGTEFNREIKMGCGVLKDTVSEPRKRGKVGGRGCDVLESITTSADAERNSWYT